MGRKVTNWIFTIALAALAGHLTAGVAFAQDAGKLVIAKDGQPAAVIVVGSEAAGDELFAAEELQTYIKKVSGASIPIKKDSEEISGNIIAVGNNKVNAAANLGTDKLEREGFRIKTGKNILSLAGKDDAGTQFAVYTFLEKGLGIRWLWPGDLGEVVPQMQTIEVAAMDVTEEPDFKWRNRGPEGALWGDPTGGPTELHARELVIGITREHQEEVEMWEKRNKWCGWKVYGGHCLGEIFPPEKYAKTHPEYYALIDGVRQVPGPEGPKPYDYKHEGQICTSSPEVIRVMVEWVRNFLDQNPGHDGVHVTLNDSAGFCECENCVALDVGEEEAKEGIGAEETRKELRRRRKVITDRVYIYVNAVAEELQKTHPGKYVFSMAYGPYITPPKKVKLHPFTVPQYCLWSCYGHADPDAKKEHEEIAIGWAKAANKKGIYEYYINGSWPGLHRIVPSHIAESLKFLYGQGIDLYQTQSGDEFATNGINYYLAGKILWDTSLDPRNVLDDFYQKGFGKAAAPVQRFHQRLEERWNETTKDGSDVVVNSRMGQPLRDFFSQEFLKQCYDDLAEAEKLADNDTIRQRVEFYKKGLRFTDLTVEAARWTSALMDLGFELTRPDTAVPGAEKAMWKTPPLIDKQKAKMVVDAAVEAWETRNAYVEEIKNDYVIAYFWVAYNNWARDTDQEKNLRKLSASLASP